MSKYQIHVISHINVCKAKIYHLYVMPNI